MAIVQERDITIFKSMRFGPMSVAAIHQSFHRENKSADESVLTLKALQQRIHVLNRDDYIKSHHYSNLGMLKVNRRALYCLTDRSIEVLVRKTDIPVEKIRSILPSEHTVIHELLVTQIVRVISRESEEKHFELQYLDENLLRQRPRKKDPGKRYVFPDLEIVTRHPDRTIGFKIELDRGTIPELRVARKIDLLANVDNYYVVVVCIRRNRIERLKQVLRDRTSALHHKNARNIFFAHLNRFKDGLFDNTMLENVYNHTGRFDLPGGTGQQIYGRKDDKNQQGRNIE